VASKLAVIATTLACTAHRTTTATHNLNPTAPTAPTPNPHPPSTHQALAGPPTGSFIVLFKTPQAATLAARSSVFPQQTVQRGAGLGGGDGGARMGLDAFKVQQAPGPEDVLWQVGGWVRRDLVALVLQCSL